MFSLEKSRLFLYWSVIMTQKTLSKLEVQFLVSFQSQVEILKSMHAEEADIIKIDYDSENDDFEITTNKKDKRKRRLSKIEADIINWVNNQLAIYQYSNKKILKIILGYENDKYTVEILEPMPASDDHSIEIEE